MNENELMYDLRERLIRIEEQLKAREESTKALEKRIDKLEGNNTWLSRTVVGQILINVMAFLVVKR